MKLTKKVVVTTLFLVGAVLFGIKGKGLLKERQEEVKSLPLPKAERMSVRLAQPADRTLRQTESFQAQLLAERGIKLSTKLAGFVEKVYVTESQHVRKGTPLVSIDATEVRSSIEALRAALSAQKNDLAVAKSIYSRNRKLYEAGGLSKERLDLSRAALEAKSSAVENTVQKIAQLEHQLSYLKIVAPFDGVIDAIVLHEGDLAAAGRPIVTMSSDTKKVVFSFSPSLLETIKTGDRVYYEGEEAGHIRAVYNTAQNGLARAEVALDRPIDLPVGSSLNITVETEKASGCTVPTDTLLHKKEGTYLMVFDEGRFEPLKVKVRLEDAEYALVTPCPKERVARGSEVKLAALPAFEHVEIIGEKDE